MVLMERLDRFARSSISTYFTAWPSIFIMAVLFLLPALDNGFPFVGVDTSRYLGGLGLTHIPESRPIFYTWFTRTFDLPILNHSLTTQPAWHLKGWSPWPSVVVQSLITAWMICRFASAVFGLTSPSRMVLLALLLTLGTSLPWFVGQIMPDLFTSLMILALALLLFVQDRLPRPSRIILVLLIGMAVAFHQANLLVALWMLAGIGFCALLGWRPSRPFPRGLFAGGIGLAFGAAALMTANLIFDGRFALSNGGSVFLLARLLEDGTALSYLKKTCPQQSFAVCAYLDELSSFRPRTDLAANFLWNGPLERLGGWRAEESEASAIVGATLREYPLAQFSAAVDNSLRQLSSFRTGEGLYAYAPTDFVSITIQNIFGPVVYDSYLKSKQHHGVYVSDQFEFMNYIHGAVLFASSLVLIGFVVLGGWQKQRRAFFVAVFVLVLVFGNAVTLGVLAGAVDRYQNRVMWLMPLLAASIVLERLPHPRHRKQNSSIA
jgi:hypothetical protein